jgi:hypothetical protein
MWPVRREGKANTVEVEAEAEGMPALRRLVPLVVRAVVSTKIPWLGLVAVVRSALSLAGTVGTAMMLPMNG